MLYPHGVDLDLDAGWPDSQLVRVYQRLLTLRRCRRVRPDGRDWEPSQAQNAIALEFRDAVSVTETLSMPVLTRVTRPASTEEGAADEFELIGSSSRFWHVRLVSALNGRVLGSVDAVKLHPEELLDPNVTAEGGSGRRLQAPGCGVGEFCAEVGAPAPVSGEEDMVPASHLQRGHRTGVEVELNVSLPRVPLPVPSVPSQVFVNGFSHGAMGSRFPAQSVLVSFIQLTAPVPLRWTQRCTVREASAAPSPLAAFWRAVCFDFDAYVYLEQYPNVTIPVPLQVSLVVNGISLVEPDRPQVPVGLPLSATWVASLYDRGRLRAQQLTQAPLSAGLIRLPPPAPAPPEPAPSEAAPAPAPAPAPPGNETNGTDLDWLAYLADYEVPEGNIGLEPDVDAECENATLQDFSCPWGMFAYGVHMTRLGGSASWLDNFQLLCKEELDVGTNQTRWTARLGTTGVVGDLRLGSRSREEAENALTDVLACDEKSSSLIVGGKVEAWRRQRFLGLTALCLPWANVERNYPWDEESGEVLYPRGITGDTEEEVGNCTSEEPIEGSEDWVSCAELPQMRMCPDEPNLCCCDEGFMYNLESMRCESCVGVNGSIVINGPRRLCPPGTAVAGFRAASFTRSGKNFDLVNLKASSAVCALELVCRAVTVRRFAGGLVTEDVMEAEEEEEEILGGLGFAPPTFDLGELEWWQYLAAGGVGLVVLRYTYVCCIRRGMTEIFEGDAEAKEPWWKRNIEAIRRLASFLMERIFEPAYRFWLDYIWHPLKDRLFNNNNKHSTK